VRYYAFFNGARVYLTSEGVHTVYGSVERRAARISEATGAADRAHASGAHADGIGSDADEYDMRLYRMDLSFEGCNADVEIEASERVPEYLNYYLAHCAEGITHVPGYRTLRYRNLYAHIDLVLHCAAEGMKWEFEVRPGGRVEDITLRYDGQEAIEEMADGSLRLHWPRGYTREDRPFTYQEGREVFDIVTSGYRREGNRIGFETGAYDHGRTLVIDPWSTYYGGREYDAAGNIACNRSGAVIVKGSTHSPDFPVHRAWQDSLNRGTLSPLNADVFIVKFDSVGQVIWATFFGGSNGESGSGMALGREDAIFICGFTQSDDLPVESAFQARRNGIDADGFIAGFDSSGIRIWATYYGGYDYDAFRAMVADTAGHLYLAGNTASRDFPVQRAFQPYYQGGLSDAVFVKMTDDGVPIISSFLGGRDEDYAYAIAVSDSSDFVITGHTWSGTFPTMGTGQTSFGGTKDAFVSVFDSSGSMRWSSFHGGSAGDAGQGCAFDSQGNILISGWTASSDLPVARALQPNYAGGISNDAFLAKFSSSGALVWGTYYGGTGGEAPASFGPVLAIDGDDNVYIAGSTTSRDFPVHNAAFPVMRDTLLYPRDGFIVKFDSAGARQWATYFGGSHQDVIYGSAVDAAGRLLICGWTYSDDLPVHNAVQDTFVGGKSTISTRRTPSSRASMPTGTSRSRSHDSRHDVSPRGSSCPGVPRAR
jgi:hypothetical protein